MSRRDLCLIFVVAAVAVNPVLGSEPIVSARLVLSVDRLRPGDSFQAAVQATVREGFHIGAHHKKALYPTEVRFKASKHVTFDAPVYPVAEWRALLGSDEKTPVYEGVFIIKARGRVDTDASPGSITITASLDTQACKADRCFPPETAVSSLTVSVVAPNETPRHVNREVFAEPAPAEGEEREVADRLAGAGIVTRLLMLYGLGVLLAFTPCVYPMIPVTVGYFSAQGQSRTRRVLLLAAVYVLGIALTYSVLGAVAAGTGGVFGAAMQSPAVLIGIAVILVALALSMFGLYELRAPSFIESRSSGRSGVPGALVMGLVFGIVAAPCVGPVVIGLLLYVARIGIPAVGFLLFFVLALGLGTPLFFLAAFSAKLPAAGLWMVAVRRTAGFLLLGVAAYFVGPLVPEPIRRLLIPAVVAAAGIYLGCIEKSVRSTKAGVYLGRLLCVAALVAAALMLRPEARGPSLDWQPYEPGSIAAAAAAGKPSMVEFTAEWCGACKELEHKTFSRPEVVRAAKRFARFRVDGTNRSDRKALAAVRKYDVQGFPTILFFDSSGREVASARIVGFVDAPGALSRMKRVD